LVVPELALPLIKFISIVNAAFISYFTIAILVLQAEGLVCAIRYLDFLIQTTPASVVAEQ